MREPDKEMPWGFKGFCEDCGAWEHNKDLKLSTLGIVVASKKRYGFCKARPPKSERPGSAGFFPVMPEDEWCFGFVKKAVDYSKA
jgi:hypothetical protein